ncbi:MAG: iron-containing alcohol dehydrogenase [Treponema sp.]|nr:iron-containing alcohol dehydrogenase [Candidatus Treponema caballi]
MFMNKAKKMYCRLFQTVFKIALPVLPYRSPEILNTIQDLPLELAERNISRVMLVTDKGLRKLSADLERLFSAQGIECIVYDKTEANPKVSNVEEAYSIYTCTGCEALVAFGGGSSIDCAKAVGARVAYPKKTLNQMKGILKIRRKLPLLAAIPTTAGTGSEVTLAAVITDDETHYKYPISSFPLIPSIAVLDPKITYSLPAFLTATTGMDALTHAVEAYIGRTTTKQTRKWAITAVRMINRNIQKAYDDGTDYEARENMLIASNYAGSAFSQSYVGYVHAVAHSLGGAYNIPHGLANAVILPYVLDAYGPAIYKKLKKLARAINLVDKYAAEEFAARKFIQHIRKLNEELGIPATLKGIKEEDIPELARRADKEANPLYPVPVLMDAEALQQFYRDVMAKEAADGQFGYQKCC